MLRSNTTTLNLPFVEGEPGASYTTLSDPFGLFSKYSGTPDNRPILNQAYADTAEGRTPIFSTTASAGRGDFFSDNKNLLIALAVALVALAVFKGMQK